MADLKCTFGGYSNPGKGSCSIRCDVTKDELAAQFGERSSTHDPGLYWASATLVATSLDAKVGIDVTGATDEKQSKFEGPDNKPFTKHEGAGVASCGSFTVKADSIGFTLNFKVGGDTDLKATDIERVAGKSGTVELSIVAVG